MIPSEEQCLSLEALRLAISVVPQGDLTLILKTAERFYQFLIGYDPDGDEGATK